MPNRLSIGELSRACRTSVKTLRRYADRGLLVPAWVDPRTGYRWFGTSQIREATRIRSLRELGVPLTDIEQILSAESPERVRAVLDDHRRRLKTEIRERRDALVRLDALIDAPDPGYVVERCELSGVDAVTVRLRTTLDRLPYQIGAALGRVGGHLARHLVPPMGAAFGITHGEAFDPDDLDVEYGLPCAEPAPPGEGITARVLEGGPAVRTVHAGSYDRLGEAYGALVEWIDAHDLEVAGPPRESYIVPPAPDRAPGALRTEVVWPVRPATGQSEANRSGLSE